MHTSISCLIFIFCFVWTAASAQVTTLAPQIDKRMELMAIAYQLAKETPIEKTRNPYYSNAIQLYFKPVKNHPLIEYIRRAITKFETNGLDIAAWELPSLAVHLTQPPHLTALVSLKDSIQSDGWDDRTLLNDEVIELINRFYADGRCEDFFTIQQPYYHQLETTYRQNNISVNQKMIKDFVGLPPTEVYYPIFSPYFESGAYLRVNFGNNLRNTHTLFTGSFTTKGDATTFNDVAIPRLMVHEYVHALVNQVVDKHKPEMKQSAERLVANPKVWNRVKDTFYNTWHFLLYESLVRACSIQYMLMDPAFQTTLEKEIALQEPAGFFWMRDLLVELNHYQANRKQYPSLEHLAPALIKFFERTASQLK